MPASRHKYPAMGPPCLPATAYSAVGPPHPPATVNDQNSVPDCPNFCRFGIGLFPTKSRSPSNFGPPRNPNDELSGDIQLGSRFTGSPTSYPQKFALCFYLWIISARGDEPRNQITILPRRSKVCKQHQIRVHYWFVVYSNMAFFIGTSSDSGSASSSS